MPAHLDKLVVEALAEHDLGLRAQQVLERRQLHAIQEQRGYKLEPDSGCHVHVTSRHGSRARATGAGTTPAPTNSPPPSCPSRLQPTSRKVDTNLSSVGPPITLLSSSASPQNDSRLSANAAVPRALASSAPLRPCQEGGWCGVEWRVRRSWQQRLPHAVKPAQCNGSARIQQHAQRHAQHHALHGKPPLRQHDHATMFRTMHCMASHRCASMTMLPCSAPCIAWQAAAAHLYFLADLVSLAARSFSRSKLLSSSPTCGQEGGCRQGHDKHVKQHATSMQAQQHFNGRQPARDMDMP